MLRRLLPVAVLLGFAGLLGTGTASATALPIQDCTTTSGVIVAVDFSHWGGPLVRGCGSTPTTGYQLVNQGGFATTGTAHDGPGFICRISYSGFNGGNGEPADQKCLTTPPASASWSYWNADPDQTGWTLSPSGAANTNPPAGAVQAWTFGSGSPSFTPASVRAWNSPPAGGGSSSAGRTGGPSGGSGGGHSSGHTGGASAPVSQPAGRPTAASSSGPGGSRSAAAKSSPAAGSATSSPTGSASDAGLVGTVLTLDTASPTASQRVVDAEPGSSPRSSGSGSYLPELAGAAIVLGLAGLTGFTVWQRKRAG